MNNFFKNLKYYKQVSNNKLFGLAMLLTTFFFFDDLKRNNNKFNNKSMIFKSKYNFIYSRIYLKVKNF